MTAVVLLATIVGMGVIGVAYGLRGHRVALDGVLDAIQAAEPLGQDRASAKRLQQEAGELGEVGRRLVGLDEMKPADPPPSEDTRSEEPGHLA